MAEPLVVVEGIEEYLKDGIESASPRALAGGAVYFGRLSAAYEMGTASNDDCQDIPLSQTAQASQVLIAELERRGVRDEYLPSR